MNRRLLKCKCGNELSVRTSQAGDQIICPKCNETISIPSLRELTNLPVDDAKLEKRWLVLPERSLPKSTTALVLGIFFLTVAVTTPVLVILGLLDDAFSYTNPADPRRTFFRLDNLSLWGGLGFLALSGFVSVLRGLGYPIAGGPSTRRDR